MTVRITFCCGLMELLTCSLLIKTLQQPTDRNFLVVYGRTISMPRNHISDTLRFAPMFGDWEQIIDLTGLSDDITNAVNQDDKLNYLRDYAPLFGSADQILIHTLWTQPDWSFLDLCSMAEIILYDNGLNSHLPRRCIDQGTDQTKFGIRKFDLERIRLAFYMLGDMLPLPDFIARTTIEVPSGQQIRTQLETIGKQGVFDQLAPIIPQQDQPLVLLAGTSFCRTGKVTPCQETKVYRNYISTIRNEGKNVLLKAHPRTPMDIDMEQDNRITSFNNSLPIEFLPCIAPFTASASISSSTLLILKKVFSINYDLIGVSLHDKLDLPWIDDLKRYASNYHD